MAVSSWRSDGFGGLTPHQLELLYEPIILEAALQKAGSLPTYTQESQSSQGYKADMPDLKAFQFFVNKLAQVCDNERGGDTITALAVLQGSRGPHYVFGSNAKDARALETAKNFVKELLDLVGKNPEDLKTAALGKRALWFILSFNIARLREYLQHLGMAIQECLESCRRKEEDEAISDCETLIKAIKSPGQIAIDPLISQRAKDGEITRSEPWCKLRHFLGRWLSYRQTALGIVAVSERWPELFQDFEITMLPSGSRLPNPILRSDLTSSIIVDHIIAEEKIQDLQLSKIADGLQQLGVDDVIRQFHDSRKFKPVLHAEPLVNKHLIETEQTSAECYWNRWNYIGSSKPTCRLCHYYFESLQGEKPTVRPSHNNLYRNWRLPDFHDDEGLTIARDELLMKIAQKMRTDVMEALREKRIKSKARDSNTHSSVPEILRINDTSIASEEDSGQESNASTVSDDESMESLERSTSAVSLGNGDE
ncbi:hypothetical protein KAF25_004275 [Fusarium avenaceum]|uniref:Uncharacterized protein n=1 Tax=Fusarium avenaceum TaxID=40199 RepID=A0A9P7KQH7_9HYPO|nr:hypothetical protein KAF25_004275 [Fusarium avenaceum]